MTTKLSWEDASLLASLKLGRDPKPEEVAAVVAAEAEGVDFDHLMAVMAAEGSSMKSVSPKGARGVMQIMPGTAREVAKELGVSPEKIFSDLETNVRAGARYYRRMLDQFKDPVLAAMAYNAGPGRIRAWLAGRSSLPAETEAYRRKVEEFLGSKLSVQPSPPEEKESFIPEVHTLPGEPVTPWGAGAALPEIRPLLPEIRPPRRKVEGPWEPLAELDVKIPVIRSEERPSLPKKPPEPPKLSAPLPVPPPPVPRLLAARELPREDPLGVIPEFGFVHEAPDLTKVPSAIKAGFVDQVKRFIAAVPPVSATMGAGIDVPITSPLYKAPETRKGRAKVAEKVGELLMPEEERPEAKGVAEAAILGAAESIPALLELVNYSQFAGPLAGTMLAPSVAFGIMGATEPEPLKGAVTGAVFGAALGGLHEAVRPIKDLVLKWTARLAGGASVGAGQAALSGADWKEVIKQGALFALFEATGGKHEVFEKNLSPVEKAEVAKAVRSKKPSKRAVQAIAKAAASLPETAGRRVGPLSPASAAQLQERGVLPVGPPISPSKRAAWERKAEALWEKWAQVDAEIKKRGSRAPKKLLRERDRLADEMSKARQRAAQESVRELLQSPSLSPIQREVHRLLQERKHGEAYKKAQDEARKLVADEADLSDAEKDSVARDAAISFAQTVGPLKEPLEFWVNLYLKALRVKKEARQLIDRLDKHLSPSEAASVAAELEGKITPSPHVAELEEAVKRAEARFNQLAELSAKETGGKVPGYVVERSLNVVPFDPTDVSLPGLGAAWKGNLTTRKSPYYVDGETLVVRKAVKPGQAANILKSKGEQSSAHADPDQWAEKVVGIAEKKANLKAEILGEDGDCVYLAPVGKEKPVVVLAKSKVALVKEATDFDEVFISSDATKPAVFKQGGQTVAIVAPISGGDYRISPAVVRKIAAGGERTGPERLHRDLNRSAVFVGEYDQKETAVRREYFVRKLEDGYGLYEVLIKEGEVRNAGLIKTAKTLGELERYVDGLAAVAPWYKAIDLTPVRGSVFGGLSVGVDPTKIVPAAKVLARAVRRQRTLPRVGTDPKAAKVDDMYERSFHASQMVGRITFEKARDFLSRMVLDTSAPAKRRLLQWGGKPAIYAITELDLARGATPRGAWEYEKVVGKVFRGLSWSEETLLNKLVHTRNMIAILKRHPRMRQPERLKLDELEAWLDDFIRNVPENLRNELWRRSNLVREVFDETLRELRDEGLISAKQYRDIISSKEYYSARSFLKFIDPVITKKLLGRKVHARDSGVEFLTKGSEDLIDFNLRRILKEVLVRRYTRIYKNRAAKALYRFVKENPDNPWVRVARKRGRGVERPGPNESEILVWIDGEPIRMIAKDEFAQGWVVSDPLVQSSLLRLLYYLSGSFITKALATGPLAPFFFLTNLPRDIMYAYVTALGPEGEAIFSRALPVYVTQIGKYMVRTFKDAWKREGRYEEMLEDGMGYEFLTHTGLTEVGFRAGRVADFLTKLARIGSKLGEVSEVWVRMAIRERALDMGYDRRTASWIARNYVDFHQGGSFAKFIDSWHPYFNASIQATRGLFKAARRDPSSFTLKVAQLFATQFMLSLLWRCIPEYYEAYKQISDHDKRNNWVFPTPIWEKDPTGDKSYYFFKIAKDQGQKLFATIAEGLVAKMFGERFDWEQAWLAAQDALVLVPASSPALMFTLGYLSNRDFWLQRDIWRGDPHVKEWAQYWLEPGRRSNPVLRFIGESTGLSPEKLKVALQQVFTRGNIYVWAIGNALWRLTEGMPWEMEERTWAQVLADIPDIRRVFSRTRPFQTQYPFLKEQLEKSATEAHVIDQQFVDLADRYYSTKNKRDLEALSKFLDTLPVEKRRRYLREFRMGERLFKQPNARFWRALRGISDPRARARAFYSVWAWSAPDQRETLTRQLYSNPGVRSRRFMSELRSLMREHNKQGLP